MQNVTKHLRGWFVVCLVVVTSGCVANAERITEIQPNAIKANTNVGVIWISPCSAHTGCKESGDASNLGQFVPDGASGLLGYGIAMSAHSDIIDGLDQVSADALVEEKFLNPIVASLEARGAIPKVVSSYHYQGDLAKDGKRTVMKLKPTLEELHPEIFSNYAAVGFNQNFDLSAIAEELDSSILVVLHLQQFGVRRSFGPLTVPLGRPHGLSLARVFVWDVESKSVMYNDYGIASASIGGGWREQEPMTQVFDATNKALELTLDRATSPLVTALQ